ncbi:MAG: ribbon-helix-helix domain-containing protein [Candidatus Bipolaricaulaceae bacterium]
MVAVRLTPMDVELLDQLARKTRTDRSAVLREAIRLYIESIGALRALLGLGRGGK